jgi:hypothetical protein
MNKLRLTVLISGAMFALCGCSPDLLPTPEQVIDDLLEGPGQPDPEIIGASGDRVLYMQPPEELQVSDWLPLVTANLYSRSLQTGQTELLAPLLDGSVRAQMHSDADVVVWFENDTVFVLNLADGRQKVLFVAGAEQSVDRVVLAGRRVLIAVDSTDTTELVFHDLISGIETVVYEGARVRDFDVAGEMLALATLSDVLLVSMDTLEQTVLVTNELVATGPFIDGQWVVWSGATRFEDDLGSSRLQAVAHDMSTGATNVLVTLHEGLYSFYEDVIAGRVTAPLWLRGASGGQAVVSASTLHDFVYRERVRLYSLESPGESREIGDFDIDINHVWDGGVASQVKVFDSRVLWYNPDGNRIVVYDLETLRKQKFKP